MTFGKKERDPNRNQNRDTGSFGGVDMKFRGDQSSKSSRSVALSGSGGSEKLS